MFIAPGRRGGDLRPDTEPSEVGSVRRVPDLSQTGIHSSKRTLHLHHPSLFEPCFILLGFVGPTGSKTEMSLFRHLDETTDSKRRKETSKYKLRHPK